MLQTQEIDMKFQYDDFATCVVACRVMKIYDNS